MHPVLFTVAGVEVRSHPTFIALGVLVALAVFLLEVRRRGIHDDRLAVVAAFTLFGGAVGMRLSGLFPHLDPARNPGLVEAWRYGAHSILGGLPGAYLGALAGKRVAGYTARTGDLFAPAVALGMAVGRVGCFLADPPGRPTTLPWAYHGMHPSFAYEIAFQLVAFAWLRRLRDAALPPGELLTVYLAAYGIFRFAVEFTRASETVWLGLTRPQWFLFATVPFLVLHLRRIARPRLVLEPA